MQRLTSTFRAKADDGVLYKIHVFTSFALKDGKDVPAGEILMTADGLSVHRIAKGHYKLHLGGISLRSKDKNAP